MAVNLFDAGYYATANPDLGQNGVITGEQLSAHFFGSGLDEGRAFSPFVNLNFYRSSYIDLEQNGLTTNRAAFEHLQNSGVAEGRRFSPFVDINHYLSVHPDLQAALGSNREAAFGHLVTSGVVEPRQYSRSFDPAFYRAFHPDLNSVASQFNWNNVNLLEHFKNSGLAEGRIGSSFGRIPGTLGFRTTNFGIEESSNPNAQQAFITVNRVDGVDGVLTVNYVTNQGTAIPGADYTPVSGTLQFAPGETSKTFQVGIINDGDIESFEDLNLSLSDTGNGALGGLRSAVLTIVDNDFTGSINKGNGPPDADDFRSNIKSGNSLSDWDVEFGDNGWDNASRTFDGQFSILIEDDPYFEGENEIHPISITGDLSGTLGFSQSTYIVNENVGTAILGLSRSITPITNATLIVQDDDRNDNFDTAIPIDADLGDPNDGFDDTILFSYVMNVGATKELGEPNHAGNVGGASVWWSWTAPASRIIEVATSTNDFDDSTIDFDSLVAVYTGSSVTSLTLVGSNDDDPVNNSGNPGDSRVIFEAVAGTTYKIALDGFDGTTFNAVALGDRGSFSMTALDNLFVLSPESSSNLSIPDQSTVTSDIFVSGLPGTIRDLDVNLNIEHTFDADLDVFLISPLGTQVELFSDVGSSGANFSFTSFDDEATTAIASGSAPFSGTFQPFSLLSSFDGQNPNGIWRLQVTDDAEPDVGTLFSWSLTFDFDQQPA